MKKNISHTMSLALLVSIALLAFQSHALTVQSWQKLTDGVLFTLDQGKMKIEVASDDILRHVYSLDSIPAPAGRIVIRTTWGTPNFQASEDASTVTITTGQLKAVVTKSNASIKYTDLNNVTLVSEPATGKSLTASSGHYQGNFGFALSATEGIYGFGQPGKVQATGTGDPQLLQNLNLRNETFVMQNCNRTANVPFFVSTNGYGILINCYSVMNVTAGISISEDWATNNVIDYYFIHGPSMDTLVSRYHWLTGPVPLLPKSAYGFISSFCQYGSQTDVENAATGYRNASIPVDYIVQDWNWWTMDGSDIFNGNYPNPTQMVSDLHAKNCSFMISVWPSFAQGSANYNTMNAASYLLGAKDYLGQLCDMTKPGCPEMYWGMIKTSPWNTGMDAWWFDATDPEILNGINWSQQYFNIYSLIHSGGVYTGQRATTSDKRVFIFTRSTYAGQQRYSGTLWSGDISPTNAEFVNQVPGGLNFCAAGMPYWTTDIGGYQSGCPDDTYLRWFEFGAFCPMFRVHGVTHKEIYLQTGIKLTAGKLYDNLRYRMMPYIYSLAWMVTNNNYTMMRMLPFDFPSDLNVRNIKDQFMFGPALLVNPVMQEGATSRSIYLPSATWYNFWTGAPTVSPNGGSTITATVPLDTIPLYARAGSILPLGPEIQYATQRADTIELRAYPGANGSFTIYEDEGNNYNYETGKYATIPITYVDNPQNMIIGARSGSFTGMDQKKVFNIVYVKSNHGVGEGKTANPDCQLIYTGAAVSCVDEVRRNNAADLPKLVKPGQTIRTAGNYVVFDRAFADISKSVVVYDLTGKLAGVKTVRENAIDLRKDFGVPNGVYIVKVNVLR
jgi:alpha-D-xyloside xylohydrolase